MTIPGIGYHNALLISSEIRDINRFPTGAKYSAYCGLVPLVHISDKIVRYGQMSHVGNKWLRWIYIEATHIARGRVFASLDCTNASMPKKGFQVA